MKKINVGCGSHLAVDWINIDVHDGDGLTPDIVASAYDLPFEKNSIDFIYAGHFLEHVSLEDIPQILTEFSRVLTANGKVMFVGPCLTKAEEKWPEMIEHIVVHAGDWDGGGHLWDSREEIILNLLTKENWLNTSIPIENVDEFWPVVSKIGWQYAIECVPNK